MIKYLSFLLSCCTLSLQALAQYAPAPGHPGSTAIPKDSAVFKAWAIDVQLQRGFRDISVPDSGYANVGTAMAAIGKAGENGTVSLGDGGSAILTFANPIKNGPGWDFAVFENSFDDRFLELAFVEVSSDGLNYYRFPAVSLTQDTLQTGPFDYTEPEKVNNLAGKYRYGFGTPFDLEELTVQSGIDLQHVTHVKIIDAVGCVQTKYASYDVQSHKVNDPWPTNFPSSGFDLDAVGVINSISTAIATHELQKINSYPNPATHILNIPAGLSGELRISNPIGQIILQNDNYQGQEITISDISTGYYYLQLINNSTIYQSTFIKQ